MEWKKLLEAVTEDYLIGLTNKGIVKRAVKDLESAAISLKEEETALIADVEEVTCTLNNPLGESKCNCPSRSICKHIVMAALYAKGQYASGMAGEKEETGKVLEETEKSASPMEENGKDQTVQERTVKEQIDPENNPDSTVNGEKTAKQEEVSDKQEEVFEKQEEASVKEEIALNQYEYQKQKVKTEVTNNTASEEEQELFPTIINYPLAKLKRAIGDKKFQNLLYGIREGIHPDIVVSSIVTIVFPDTGITVRLLEPVEYSSCSCHKKELCQHKAEAILYYQLYAGRLKEQELMEEPEENSAISMEESKEFAKLLKAFLEEQLATGLARSSLSVLDSLERLAIIGHNLKLPDFERRLRELKGEYELYFKRAASFQVTILLYRLCSLYKRAEALEGALTKAELTELAGEFHTEYYPCPPLKLAGMGQREIHSKSGYEGEAYYFFCEDTGEWYTYTNVRPVYYDEKKKRIPGDKSKAPWQLPCKLEDLTDAEFILYNGKASKKHRLSATSEAKSEYFGVRKLNKENFKMQYFEDFMQLFEERLKDSWQQEEAKNNLVLIQADHIKNASFDTIKQEYSMELYDKEEQRIILEVPYSKAEHYTIRFLERLAKRLEQGEVKIPCFFGSIYMGERAVRLYPINYFDLE
jgi:hypothetical protein